MHVILFLEVCFIQTRYVLTPCSENRNRKVSSAAGDTGVFIHRRKDILIGLRFDPVAIFFAESYVYTMVSQSWSGEALSRQTEKRKMRFDSSIQAKGPTVLRVPLCRSNVKSAQEKERRN